jgi:hypothetical protein
MCRKQRRIILCPLMRHGHHLLTVKDYSGVWQEVPLRYEDFSISINKVDSDLEYGYKEEVKELKKRVLKELNAMSNENTK